MLLPSSPVHFTPTEARFRSRRDTFYVETPGSFGFGPLRSTRLACPALTTGQAFITALTQTKTYRISGDTLRLLNAAGVPLARLATLHGR